MSRRYTHEDTAEIKRKLTALLPASVTCMATLTRDGWGLTLSVCGPQQCHAYEFGPGLNDIQILRVSEQWKGGTYAPPMPAPGSSTITEAQSLAHFVDNRNELMQWVREGKRGSRVVYFRGNLAQFRADAPKDVVRLQSKNDQKVKPDNLEAGERVSLTRIQNTLDMLEAINTLQVAGLIDVAQQRMADNTGFVYYAAKR